MPTTRLRASTSADKTNPALTQPVLRIYLQNQGQHSLPVSNLVFMKAETNYTWLVWANGERMLMPRTLKYYESKLPAGSFIRPHRTYAVNVGHITEIEQLGATVCIHLSGGTQLAVARCRWPLIRIQLFKHGIW